MKHIESSRMSENVNVTKTFPWKDGYYKLCSCENKVFHVTGEQVEMENLFGESNADHQYGTWKCGKFGETREEIREFTGKSHYNVDIEMYGGVWKDVGVTNEDGTTITVWNSMLNELDHFELISDEDLSALKQSGDPASAPSHHYKMQSGIKGKLLWVSGVPGSGKSTSAHVLSKANGYVYYEGDSFQRHLNPYIPPHVEDPTLAMLKQKSLKEIPKDRLEAVDKGLKEWMKWIGGTEYNKENIKGYYTALCKDIKAERERLGGDWVIAQVAPTKAIRDHIRGLLGHDVVFIALDITREDQRRRLSIRHPNNTNVIEWLVKCYDLFEPLHSDEENVVNVIINNNMSRDDVVKKILDLIPA